MFPNLVLRRIEPVDSADISTLYGDNFGRPWSVCEIQDLINQPSFAGYVVIHENNMVAFIMGMVVMGEAEIYSIFVEGKMRRRGLATMLLDALHTDYPDLGMMYLEVAKGNRAAQKFYEKMGFSVQGLRKKYYKKTDGYFEDAVLMSKSSFGK